MFEDQLEKCLEVDELVLKNFQILDILGRGAYGVVWKAQDKSTQEIIALKKIFNAFTTSKDAQRTYREVMILEQMANHPNIIKLRRVIKAENDQDLYMVFDFMQTDLFKAIKEQLIQFTPLNIKKISYQIALGLQYLHSANFIHRDIKSANILLDLDCTTKIADFGLSRHIHEVQARQEEDAILTEYVATRWYRAPELILGSQQYTKFIDIWGFGCLLAEMYIKRPLFAGNSTIDQIQKILQVIGKPKADEMGQIDMKHAWSIISNVNINKKSQNLNNIFKEFKDDSLLDLLKQCLQFSPIKRININQLLSHKYFYEVREEYQIMVQNYDGPTLFGLDDPKQYNIKHYKKIVYQSIISKKKQEIKQKKNFRLKVSSNETNEDNANTHPLPSPKSMLNGRTFHYKNKLSVPLPGEEEKKLKKERRGSVQVLPLAGISLPSIESSPAKSVNLKKPPSGLHRKLVVKSIDNDRTIPDQFHEEIQDQQLFKPSQSQIQTQIQSQSTNSQSPQRPNNQLSLPKIPQIKTEPRSQNSKYLVEKSKIMQLLGGQRDEKQGIIKKTFKNLSKHSVNESNI